MNNPTLKTGTLPLQKIRWWCRVGFVCLAILGSLIHFIYPLSGYSNLTAWFAPVNESVWEHFKLGYWALFIFSCIEFPYVKSSVHNYFLAKGIGIVLLTVTIPVVFYTYTPFTGYSILAVDIGSYFLGSFLCQWAAYRIYRMRGLGRAVNGLGLFTFLAFGIILVIFTWAPPHQPVFKERSQQIYGIPPVHK